jgi:hypothetical protein
MSKGSLRRAKPNPLCRTAAGTSRARRTRPLKMSPLGKEVDVVLSLLGGRSRGGEGIER